MMINNENVGENIIEIAGVLLKRDNKVKFLRLLIDDRLSFKNNFINLQKQLSMATGMLNRISSLVPIEVKLKAYYALVDSKLMHSIISLGKISHGN